MRPGFLLCRRASFWAPLVLFLVVVAGQSLAWTPRKPILHGAVTRPFPTIFQIDYPLCRAEAWLNALDMAEKRLPEAPSRLGQLLRGGLARKTAAGLYFPVDVVTPPNTNGNEIRVFLEDNANPGNPGDADSVAFLLKMCLVWETADTAARLRRIWPTSMESAREKLPELEALGSRLNALWQAWNAPQTDAPVNSGSATLLLARALKSPGTAESAANAARAIDLLLAREIAPEGRDNAPLWNHLAAQAIYLRALREEKQGQLALALAGYNTVIARLKKSAFPDNISPQAFIARAALRGQGGDVAGMCADYLEACGMGECQGLAAARRRGECGRQ